MKNISILLVLLVLPAMAIGQNRNLYEEVLPFEGGVLRATVDGAEVWFGVDMSRSKSVVRRGMGDRLANVAVGERLFRGANDGLDVVEGDVPRGTAGVLGRDFFARSVITIDAEQGYMTVSAPYKPAYMPLRNRTDMSPAGGAFTVLSGGRSIKAPLDSLLKMGVVTFDLGRGKVYFERHELLAKSDVTVSHIRRDSVAEGAVASLDTSGFLREVFDFRAGGEWKYRGTQPCVIDFWATWCKPCLELNPAVEALAAEFGGRVKFYKVNVDQEREVARYFNVVAIPQMVFVPAEGAPRAILVTSSADIRKNVEAILGE